MIPLWYSRSLSREQNTCSVVSDNKGGRASQQVMIKYQKLDYQKYKFLWAHYPPDKLSIMSVFDENDLKSTDLLAIATRAAVKFLFVLYVSIVLQFIGRNSSLQLNKAPKIELNNEKKIKPVFFEQIQAWNVVNFF